MLAVSLVRDQPGKLLSRSTVSDQGRQLGVKSF